MFNHERKRKEKILGGLGISGTKNEVLKISHLWLYVPFIVRDLEF